MTKREQKHQDYEAFTEKFKHKLTTDDCYTPPEVYDTVLSYARRMNPAVLHPDAQIVRPFYPGGDYTNPLLYPDGSVVVDNPPFSILASIIDYYINNGVHFFLFAPSLLLFSYANRPGLTCLCAYVNVTYHNGATVRTSFLTNFFPGSPRAVICGTLHKELEAANVKAKKVRQLPALKYPDSVITSAIIGKIAVRGIDLTIPRDESAFIRRLDCGRKLFGAGLLISERIAAERLAAERLAAVNKEVIELSPREKEIVRGLRKTVDSK